MRIGPLDKSQKIMVIVVFSILSSIGFCTIVGAIFNHFVSPFTINHYDAAVVLGLMLAIAGPIPVWLEKRSEKKQPETTP